MSVVFVLQMFMDLFHGIYPKLTVYIEKFFDSEYKIPKDFFKKIISTLQYLPLLFFP